VTRAELHLKLDQVLDGIDAFVTELATELRDRIEPSPPPPEAPTASTDTVEPAASVEGTVPSQTASDDAGGTPSTADEPVTGTTTATVEEQGPTDSAAVETTKKAPERPRRLADGRPA